MGKAKSLKKRCRSSYFVVKTAGINRKTRKKWCLRSKKIEITIDDSEFDALLLRKCAHRRKCQPKYNILLKDDKTYPYICLTKENYPRIIPTRRVIPSRGTYFGPFASVGGMKNVLDLIHSLFTIRTCKLDLSPYQVQSGKYKVCLEYHIGNCLGPCEGKQKESDYDQQIEQAKHILKGNLGIAKTYFKKQMQDAAEEYLFEKAQHYKNKLELLEKYQAKSLVVNQSIADIDVFSIVSDEKVGYVNYLKIKNGTIILTKTVEVKKKLDELDEELLESAIVRLRDNFNSEAKEIITNIELSDSFIEADIQVPKIGDKRKLIELSLKNALYYKKEKALALGATKDKGNRVLKQLQADLQLKELPDHIECFDNSNIQGTNPVASMVYFKNGKPANKEYRHYNIKSVVGPDDFASMKEVVGRRYKKVLEEGLPLPKLIVIDGGKGQLSSACEALKSLDLYGKIPIIGIAKRLEEILLPRNQFPLHIDKKSESLRLLQKVRDEAHRFAITFHRNQRSKNAFGTSLTDIEGIGKATAEKLLKQFKSVKKVQSATLDQLVEVLGKAKGEKVYQVLQGK